MAGITQTIPSFIAGISEQPDHLKFQGQVRDIVNAVPDVTLGLYKRPGSKRIDTSLISEANNNFATRNVSTDEGKLKDVQSGGSWFHYFRDESEGSYVGQVASNGQLRVWRCSDGRLMNTVYGTGGQTAIQNYLATSEPENLQFLTINDTTFVSSRDASNPNTLVGTTGTTDDRPEAHCAMIELLRTENGRQYGINIYDSTATANLPSSLTTVKRATKIKITGNNYDESDGSGHCPGIGTEVYAVTAANTYGATSNVVHVKNSSGTTITSDKTNLTFRITALGQQGVSPNYSASSSGPGGNNYRCSYNLEVVLLHGGEGWDVGDVIRVEPEHASEASSSDGQAYIEVTVTEIETTQVKATLTNNGDGLIRPAPTPFDADTAVTADTILAGITAQLPSGISAKVIGPGIYLSSSNPFSVEIAEEDLMRVFQKTINEVTLLPNMCRHGYIVQVKNARMSEEDDYYLRFDGENQLDGAGSWTECAKPGIEKSLTNMPLVIQRTAATEFTIKQYTYQDRRVGDDNTNPMPTFKGKRINKVLFHRNRLAFLAGENVVTSRPGTLAIPDFFVESALTVAASDPIDISAASMFPSDIFDGIEINAGLLVFSSNQQFLLSSDDTVLNPDTAKLRSVSTYNYNIDMPPISLGTTIAYLDNSNKFSRMNQMANTAREGEPSIAEISKLVPTLLPKDLDLLTNSRENGLILIGKTGTDIVYGYKYLQTGEKVQQQAWFKWKLNNPLLYHFIINDEYFFLDTDHFLQSLKLVESDTDPSFIQDDVGYQIHLDNHVTIDGGVYSPTTQKTTFSNVDWLSSVTTPNYDLALIDVNTNATRIGRYAKPTIASTTSFTVPGDWSGATLHIGYLYEYLVEFPRIYPKKQIGEQSKADVNSSLIIHRLKLHFGKIGLYETTLTRVGKSDYTEIYESSLLDEYDVSDAPYLEEYIKTIPVYEKNKNVEIRLKSNHPAPATLRAMAWEGDYSPLFYKRA
tara:strand:- start:9730 stop:12666 length:2937 start_codon:yes stop_codon:yes gene_type:complete